MSSMLHIVGRRSSALVLALAAAAVLFGAIITARALAYNGEFCYNIYIGVSQSCQSNKESNIRRAVGHGADWTSIEVQASGGSPSKSASCMTDGCTADTGYLSRDVTGLGSIVNLGDPCHCGGGTYYGWLYP